MSVPERASTVGRLSRLCRPRIARISPILLAFNWRNSRTHSFLPPISGVLLIVGIIVSLSLAHRTPASAQTTNFVNLNTWPVDDAYRAIIAYPDTEWTWNYLGFNPGYSCPPYRERGQNQSRETWRDPSLPEDADWAQASLGNGLVGCYTGHRATDIFTRPGAPVYAAADGVVALVSAGGDASGDDGAVVIDHTRVVEGVAYAWRARYVHLHNDFPVTSGPVREGQLVGWVADRGSNSHLHFSVEGLWDCWPPECTQNPWGPVYLWVDDDFDSWPDPATIYLEYAPAGQNLLINGGFADGLDHWLTTPRTMRQTLNSHLRLWRDASAGRAAIEQVIPYAVDRGTDFEITLTLGNDSSAAKLVGVSLRGLDTWSGYVGCMFSLPPGAAPATYTVRGRSGRAWTNFILAVSVYPADGLPAVTVDDVRLAVRPGAGVGGRECIGPVGG